MMDQNTQIATKESIANEEQIKMDKKRAQMLNSPVEKLVCKMAVPTIVSMMVTAFYNLADTFFVGKLNSNSATGAVGLVFALMAMIQACGFFFGHGSGNYISRKLVVVNTKRRKKWLLRASFLLFSWVRSLPFSD